MLQTVFVNPSVSRYPSTYNPMCQGTIEDMKWHEIRVLKNLDSAPYDPTLSLNLKEEGLV